MSNQRDVESRDISETPLLSFTTVSPTKSQATVGYVLHSSAMHFYTQITIVVSLQH